MSFSELITKLRFKLSSFYQRTLGHYLNNLFTTPVSILFLGIDNAGKTTLLNLLKSESTQATRPTNHPTSTEIELGNITANIFDLGGHEAVRIIWDRYFHTCQGIVFIIDADDQERFEVVKNAFSCVLKHSGENDVPISVLINKMDLVYAKLNGVGEVEEYIRQMCEVIGCFESQRVKLTYVCMRKDEAGKINEGIFESFGWLERAIRASKGN